MRPITGVNPLIGVAHLRVRLRARLGWTPSGWAPTLVRPNRGAPVREGHRPRYRGGWAPAGWGRWPEPAHPHPHSAARSGASRVGTAPVSLPVLRPIGQRVRLGRYTRYRRWVQSYRAHRRWWWTPRTRRLAALLRRRLAPRLRRYRHGVALLPDAARYRYRRSLSRAARRHARGVHQYNPLPRQRRPARWARRRRIAGAPRVRPVGPFRRRRTGRRA